MRDQTAGGIVVNSGKICLTKDKGKPEQNLSFSVSTYCQSADKIQTNEGNSVDEGFWFIPKGHMEKGETEEQTARREILEEAGIRELKLIKKLGIIKRLTMRTNVPKDIHCFLFKTGQKELEPTDKRHTAEWFEFEEAIEKLCFREEKDFLLKYKREIILQ